MPIYVYEHVDDPPDTCPARFERVESVTTAPLTQCLCCERPVRRIPSTFSAPTDLANKLRDRGFARLKRRDKGAYEAD